MEKDLEKSQAVEKIKEFAEKTGTCMFCTHTKDGMFSRPMSCRDIDEDGKIYFISPKDSDKNHQLQQNPFAHLIISNTSDVKFMDIGGKVEISEDKNLIDKHWNELYKSWFESKDDPNITLLIFEPQEGHYWESENGKIVSFLKMAKSIVTNSKPDLGTSGDIKL